MKLIKHLIIGRRYKQMSKIFKQGNWSEDDVCPICKTSNEGEVVLISIFGTEDRNNIEAK